MDIESLKDIDSWLKEVEANCNPDIPKIIIGNKKDLRDINGKQLSVYEMKLF